MKTILVQISEPSWTMQALHLACALARNNAAQIILLRLMPVRHPSYLGSAFGNSPPTEQERHDMAEYAATAEDYGVELSIQPMQCATVLGALVDAADQLNVDAVFAHIHKSWIPYWHQFQTWDLRRQLSAAHRQLFTLDSPPQHKEYVPAIMIESSHTEASK
ncbi:MAG: hypothetical protein JNJ61_20855 [Anaerolineae bacterium]|nr:hypothetical protein [Anaerolineae bacterium]